jgi:predicted nucleic acid-binding protein
MIYVDTDFLLALAKDDDRLETNARAYRERFEDELTTSLTTFVELILVAERYDLDRTRILLDTLEIVDPDFPPDLVFQADELVDEGFTVFDAFHASQALFKGMDVLSSDQTFEALPLHRHALEEEPAG